MRCTRMMPLTGREHADEIKNAAGHAGGRDRRACSVTSRVKVTRKGRDPEPCSVTSRVDDDMQGTRHEEDRREQSQTRK
ncbi:hypothetical protein FKM82_007730 [Ascaphus truei]